MNDRPLDLNDIQGDILGGFNTEFQELRGFGALTNEAQTASADWLAGLADEVTSVAEVREKRPIMRAPVPPDPSWLSVAISRTLLGAIAPDVVILDQPFFDGMIDGAASSLADKSDPANWKAGAPDRPIDVLLKIAGNNAEVVNSRASELVAAAAARGLELTYEDSGRRLPGEAEHFGFRDGIAQPSIVGDGSAGVLWPGHFVFGYPRVAAGKPPKLAVDPRGITDNGSMLVFRRLTQDVKAFRAFSTEQTAELQAVWPNLKSDHLEALIVGRWPSGAPASPIETSDPRHQNPDDSFNFHGDDNGDHCPFGAHIRKVNPRLGSSDVVNVPRILRRGIPFGPTFDKQPAAERGLLFLAYQSSIADAFLFISSRWMNSEKLPGKGDDVLVGRPFDSRKMWITGPNGPIELASSGKQWIIPTGGAYLFAPGISGLRKLGMPPSNLQRLDPRSLFATAKMRITQFVQSF